MTLLEKKLLNRNVSERLFERAFRHFWPIRDGSAADTSAQEIALVLDAFQREMDVPAPQKRFGH